MKTLDEQLIEALDQIAKDFGVKTAETIHKSSVTAEEKLAVAQQVLDGAFAEAVPAWRRPAGESKLAEEIRESLKAPATVAKRNGAADNCRVFTGSESAQSAKQKLYESALHMGLSPKEAKLFASDDNDLHFQEHQHLFEE
ncbi:MAG TPA: hypothetical protein VKR59_04655 [Terriglobales bacterium]|nr:hypothetical protein [Terriglobales bacterium]